MLRENRIEVEKVELPLLKEREIQLDVLRLDKVHLQVSGNKWFKLKYNLQEAARQGYRRALSFGGAYSNHIHALSASAKANDLESIGIIRGERVEPLNPTLKFAEEQDMDLRFVTRSQYRHLKSSDGLDELKNKYPDAFIIPEGGSNPLAVKGCSEIMDQVDSGYDKVVLAVGTGGTMAGIVASNYSAEIVGIPVLKGNFLQGEIERLLDESKIKARSRYSLQEEYHFGGYAKFDQELITFINNFKQETGIPLDPIYTGKMMFGVMDMIRKSFWCKGSRILAIHTGGLQGIAGFNQRFGDVLI